MFRAISPSISPASTPRQTKVVLQRQYREKEGECFNTLRDVINELTGEELQTRQEILRKAIDLLLTASQMRKLKRNHVVEQPYAPTTLHAAQNASASVHVGQPSGLCQSSQDWQSDVEFNAQMAYYASQTPHQLAFNAHHAPMNLDPTGLDPAGCPGYPSGNWPSYP